MRKKKSKENYLEKIPVRKREINWSNDENGAVVLEKENKGAANKLAQVLLKKPKISYIHLDETGSFVWNVIDGKKNIIAMGKAVEAKFGKKAQPLYERLAQYIKMLENYGFIDLL